MSKKVTQEKYISVPAIQLYRFLLGEARYGYTRNNHLMPSGAFDECNTYLKKMYEVDKELTLHTSVQLCEECISYIESVFYDGNDDEFGNREKAIEFIKGLSEFIEEILIELKDENTNASEHIYNYDSFLRNLSEDERAKYIVKDVFADEVVDKLFTKNEYLDYIFKRVKDIYGDDAEFMYNKYKAEDNEHNFFYDILNSERDVILKFKVINIDFSSYSSNKDEVIPPSESTDKEE